MSKTLRDVLARAETWPDWAQRDLAEIASQMDREVRGGRYRATSEELDKLDEAAAQVRRGEVVSGAELEAIFAKHRKA
ncbi:hypothetical protein CCR97_10550 [Rhodoplanes elegans]|uniref:Uncharacterized protein n=1 Tax=Rhodoplanes elegans TaxID=29408 RepID=A0A327K987_9BRAD|nr:hypothetical protein [Rhodoplanes elegans]MBK5958646.1 hypothetical protein [Rhodoplanes elegans]RAI34574.1 hypothetical protein CH338_20675 [Rhodoplanes elegans]